MPLRAVIFDLDDTLIKDEELTCAAFDIAARVAASRHPGLDCAEFARRAREASERIFAAHPHAADWNALGIAAAEVLWAEFADEEIAEWAPTFRKDAFSCALRELGKEGDGTEESRAFARARLEGECLMPGAQETLERLKGRCLLGLLTNGDARVQREKLKRSGLESSFDAVIVSGEKGVGKPRREIFDVVLRRLGVLASEAVMVGNSLARDVAGARAAGFSAAIWLRVPGAEELADARPTHEVSQLIEIADIVENQLMASAAASAL